MKNCPLSEPQALTHTLVPAAPDSPLGPRRPEFPCRRNPQTGQSFVLVCESMKNNHKKWGHLIGEHAVMVTGDSPCGLSVQEDLEVQGNLSYPAFKQILKSLEMLALVLVVFSCLCCLVYIIISNNLGDNGLPQILRILALLEHLRVHVLPEQKRWNNSSLEDHYW